MPFSIVLGTSDHVLSAFFTFTTVSTTCGFSVSGVIVPELDSEVNSSVVFGPAGTLWVAVTLG